MKKFPIYRQHDQMDCGPTCLRMIAKTSTTFINGYELPSSYRVKDLVPLIPVLNDVFGHMKEQNSMKEYFSSDQIEEK